MKKTICIAFVSILAAASLFAEMDKTAAFGQEIYDKEGVPVKTETLSAKIYGIYFSAHWCPPCQRFSPELVDMYNRINRKEKVFEIIFVSSDRSPKAQFEYMEELDMPWYTMKHRSKAAAALSKKYNIKAIPTLIIIDAEGNLITKDGCRDVSDLEKKAYEKWLKNK